MFPQEDPYILAETRYHKNSHESTEVADCMRTPLSMARNMRSHWWYDSRNIMRRHLNTTSYKWWIVQIHQFYIKIFFARCDFFFYFSWQIFHCHISPWLCVLKGFIFISYDLFHIRSLEIPLVCSLRCELIIRYIIAWRSYSFFVRYK